ncbi:MurR/RpiR family transcriptional regulator [Acetonema longum]|uniref:RpiR family transcriptional regulator n=1 Tax=Acetonema longum DSM 6540 TaxID=1009370 RepID=F7NJM4_9FIRM|nr:MurR/RpiR family transcriptional regulator [Acetonema longum]EGO63760.1 RpiR family transcriptional regulator [Acetonema longum DSM 6540]
MTLFTKIRLNSNRFTAAQERIVSFLQNNIKEAIELPINELAACCQVGDATVIRFYRSLGYETYARFRIALAKELSDNEIQPVYDEVELQDGLSDVIRKVIGSSIQSISDLENQISLSAVEDIVAHLQNADMVHVFGMGASGIVAQDAMHKLMRLGVKIKAYSDSHLMAVAASVAQPNEMFFAVCHSGETIDILKTLQLARQRGCYTCALTSYTNSSITGIVDAYLLTCSRETKMRSDAMISRIVQLVVIDILYVKLSLQIGDAALERVYQSRIALKHYRR